MLTGTPLQNDLKELQNLLGFLLPDIFHEEDAVELSTVQVLLYIRYPWPKFICLMCLVNGKVMMTRSCSQLYSGGQGRESHSLCRTGASMLRRY